jgi:hypothetical protein
MEVEKQESAQAGMAAACAEQSFDPPVLMATQVEPADTAVPRTVCTVWTVPDGLGTTATDPEPDAPAPEAGFVEDDTV